MSLTLSELFRQSVSEPCSLNLEVGQSCVRVHYPDQNIKRDYSPPLLHLKQGEASPDLAVFCFFNNANITEWLDNQGLGSMPHRTYQQGTIRWSNQGDGLFWLDEAAGTGYFWGNSTAAFEPYRSKPFSRFFYWFFENRNLLWCHAACVGTKEGGLLIPNVAGAGKSTAAAAAMLGGLDYLGDDFLLIDTDNQEVMSIYSSIMLSENSQKLLSGLPNADLLKPAFLGNKNKWCHHLFPAFSGQLPASLPLSAILVPELVFEQKSQISPISKEEAMSAFVSSVQTGWLFGGNPGRQLRGWYGLVQQTPVAKLQIGNDLKGLAGVLEGFLTKTNLPTTSLNQLKTNGL